MDSWGTGEASPVAIPALVETGAPFPEVPRVFLKEISEQARRYLGISGDRALCAMREGCEPKGEYITSLTKGPPSAESLHLISLETDCSLVVEDGSQDKLVEALSDFNLIEYVDTSSRLRFLVDVRANPSGSAERFHLYLDALLVWPDYLRFLAMCRDARLINQDFFLMSERNKMSILLRPGFAKRKHESRSDGLISLRRHK